MAVSKKPRRKYRPKPVNPGAFASAIIGTQPLCEDQQTSLGAAYRGAFQGLRLGAGTEELFNTLACALNIAMVLCERGCGAEFVERVKGAQDGLMRCKARGAKLGKWALDGEAIVSLEAALAVHDAQMEAATQREIREAIAEVRRRVEVGEVLECAPHPPLFGNTAGKKNGTHWVVFMKPNSELTGATPAGGASGRATG